MSNKLLEKALNGCTVPPEVSLAISTKLPAIVMVLGVISNKGNVMPQSEHRQAAGFRKVAFNSSLEQIAGNWHYIIHQDSVPAHNSKKTQHRLKENLPEVWEKEVWPQSSPDCNSLD